MRFQDRQEAGEKLAQALKKYQGQGVVVFALPRGGVILGAIVAKFLNSPLDLLIPRKIGHQFESEYALCAVCEDGAIVCNEADLQETDQLWFEEEKKKEIAEAKRRREKYLASKKPVAVLGKVAIIVDDGVATGLTMLAAIKSLKAKRPSKIVVAVPVTPRDSADFIRQQVDELVALDEPKFYLGSVGAYYADFPQVSDEEVIKIMQQF